MMTEHRLWGSTKCGDLQRRSLGCYACFWWCTVLWKLQLDFWRQRWQLRGGVEREGFEYPITEWACEIWICREDNAWLGRWKKKQWSDRRMSNVAYFFFENRDFLTPPKECAQRGILKSVGLVACQNHQKLNTDRSMLLFLPRQLPLPSVREHLWEAWHMTSLCTCARQDCCFQSY